MRWLAVVAVLLVTGCAGAPQQQRPGLWVGVGLAVAAGLVVEDSRDDDGPCVDFTNCQQP